MFPANYSRSLARTDEMPLDERRATAKADLNNFAQQAAKQKELNDYAVAASNEVLQAVSLATLPYINEFQDFLMQAGVAQAATQDKLAQSAYALVAPRRTFSPDEKDVKRTLAKATHPDKAADDTEISRANMRRFQDLEAAKRRGNTATQLSEYAKVLAVDDEDDVAKLELKRYKAWLALEGSRSKFTSEAEVDEWKEAEFTKAPFTARASSMAILTQQLSTALGANPKTGEVVIPVGLQGPLREFNRIFERTVGAADDTSSVKLSEFTSFDNKMSTILPSFVELIKNHTAEEGWSQARFSKTLAIINSMTSACRMLEVQNEMTFGTDFIFRSLRRIAETRVNQGDPNRPYYYGEPKRSAEYPDWYSKGF